MEEESGGVDWFGGVAGGFVVGEGSGGIAKGRKEGLGRRVGWKGYRGLVVGGVFVGGFFGRWAGLFCFALCSVLFCFCSVLFGMDGLAVLNI